MRVVQSVGIRRVLLFYNISKRPNRLPLDRRRLLHAILDDFRLALFADLLLLLSRIASSAQSIRALLLQSPFLHIPSRGSRSTAPLAAILRLQRTTERDEHGRRIGGGSVQDEELCGSEEARDVEVS